MYFAVFLILFVLALVYFKIADRYNIIDKPNHRSAHTEITLRGGGIIFPIAFLLFLGSQIIQQKSLISPQNYFIFGIGLLAICIISFIDDILDLSSKIRLIFHFIAVTLLLYFVGVFTNLPIWVAPILYILSIGILNAYNFMDGINGMTGLYSLVILGALWYVNTNLIPFVDNNFIIYPILATIVFLFFNYRKKAKCFMGDVGSMGIAFWIIALIGLLMVLTKEIKWILFLTVYGTEVILTILERIKLKENIFQAHRRHLYQLLSNEKKVDQRIVSLGYALVQLLINIYIITASKFNFFLYILIIFPTVAIYLYLKLSIKKNIQN